MIYCACCGFKLTKIEIFYYGFQCEQCTQDDHDRLQKWLAGSEDKVLDERYGNARPAAFNA